MNTTRESLFASPTNASARAGDQQEARRAALDLRLGAVLRAAARSYGAFAAELWLLDSSTQVLRRRAVWESESHTTPSPEPRNLELAEGDLAAMAGGAVVLTDPAELLEWQAHRPARAASCLPVCSERTIYGTLWLHHGENRDYSEAELELLEVVAGRLAVEIELDACRA